MYPDCFRPSPEQAEADLHKAGIGKICGSVLLQRKYDPEEGFAYLRECNEKALRLKEIWGDFYVPGFHVHPHFVKESCEETERMHKKGVRLIGELVPYMHGWKDYSCKGLREILDVAESFHMVVSFHTMTEEQAEMNKMIEEHPGITFVAAHPGQKSDYLLHLERMKRYDNFFLDLSGTGLFRYGMLAHGVKEAGADRFLFGTDYPICNPGMYVQAVRHEPISDEDRAKVFGENAEQILYA